MGRGATLQELLKIVILLSLGMSAGIIMVYTDMSLYLEELSEVRASDVIGVLGTIYALFTAFILVNVWTHFNTTNVSIGKENEALIAIWNNTDYLEDDEISSKMNEALTSYLSNIIQFEFPELKKRRSIMFPAPEFIQILKVIDKVKFDDPRDPIAFEALIDAYKDLSNARNARIGNTRSQIPSILRVFFVLASFIFWGGYLIEGFESVTLYFIVLGGVTLIVVMSYVIITDLDNTLNGILQVDMSTYEETLFYIKATKHEIFHDETPKQTITAD